jgi:hypothetical protein
MQSKTNELGRPRGKMVVWATWALCLVAYLFVFYDRDFIVTQQDAARYQPASDLNAVSLSGNEYLWQEVQGAVDADPRPTD